MKEERNKKKENNEPEHSPYILRIPMIMFTLTEWPAERNAHVIAVEYG
jgi:hypothetical protein